MRQGQQCAMGGGVAAARITAAHRAGLHPVASHQGVGQGRFAGAGRPHQYHRIAGAQPGRKLGGAGRIARIECQHRDAAAFDPGQLRAQRLHVFTAVGLGQHQHRPRAAGVDQHQIALQPAQVEVAIQPGDHQHGVDIGRDRLHFQMLACGTALQQAAARQQFHDLVLLRLQPHEIPDHGALFRCESLARPRCRRLHREFAFAIADAVAGTVLFTDPRHAPMRRLRPGQRGRMVRAPAQSGQCDLRVRKWIQGGLSIGCKLPSGAIRWVASSIRAAMRTRSPIGTPR